MKHKTVFKMVLFWIYFIWIVGIVSLILLAGKGFFIPLIILYTLALLFLSMNVGLFLSTFNVNAAALFAKNSRVGSISDRKWFLPFDTLFILLLMWYEFYLLGAVFIIIVLCDFGYRKRIRTFSRVWEEFRDKKLGGH